MTRKLNEKQYFTSVEDMYKERFNAFLVTANSHIFNSDYAVDAVHNAFIKALEYQKRKPGCHFRERVMHVLVMRAAKKVNKKYGIEIPFETTEQDLSGMRVRNG